MDIWQCVTDWSDRVGGSPNRLWFTSRYSNGTWQGSFEDVLTQAGNATGRVVNSCVDWYEQPPERGLL